MVLSSFFQSPQAVGFRGEVVEWRTLLEIYPRI
jgi:hypothetical protein